MHSHKKPGVAFWATVVLVVALLVGYPLSFGPACWWFCANSAPPFYMPIGWLYERVPLLGDAIGWYAMLLRRDNVTVPCGPGNKVVVQRPQEF